MHPKECNLGKRFYLWFIFDVVFRIQFTRLFFLFLCKPMLVHWKTCNWSFNTQDNPQVRLFIYLAHLWLIFFPSRGYGCKILMDTLEEYNQLSHRIIPLLRIEGEQGMCCMYHLFPFYNLVIFA